MRCCPDPVPGGCNLELPLENDPNLYLTALPAQSLSHVKFAYGDLSVSGVRQRCGSPFQHSELVYDVYQMYLSELERFNEETFFAAVGQMLKAKDVSSASRWV